MNQFTNIPAFPDATYKDVVRPNVDTLYSLMWFDVSQEPLLISVPDSGGRYYMLPDAATCGPTCSTARARERPASSAQVLAIAGPGWQGQLPADATLIYSPTAIGWISGARRPNGKADYDAVRRFQAGLNATPLSQWGKPYQPPTGKINPDLGDEDTTRRSRWKGSGQRRISRCSPSSPKLNPPHANDYPILHQMRRIGIEPGKPFAFDKASPEIQRALTEAGPAAIEEDQGKGLRKWASRARDGASNSGYDMGTYGD